jgi:hypothetical protein
MRSTMKQAKCSGEHTVHICELSSKGKHVEIVDIVKNPEYMCMNCGRVAAAQKNLCNPEALDDIRPSGA